MYKCDKCNYETNDNSNYKRHISSKRHLQDLSQNEECQKQKEELTNAQQQRFELQRQKLEMEREKEKVKMERANKKLELEKEKLEIQKLKMEAKIKKEKEKEQKKINDELAKQMKAEETNEPVYYYGLDIETILQKTKFNIKYQLETDWRQLYPKFIDKIFKNFRCVRIDKSFPLYLDGKPFVSPTKEQIDEMRINNTYVNHVKSLEKLDIPCEIYVGDGWSQEQTVMGVYNDVVEMMTMWKDYNLYKNQIDNASDLKRLTLTHSMVLNHVARILASCMDGSNYLEEKLKESIEAEQIRNEKILQKREEQENRERQSLLDRDKIAERQRKEMEQKEARENLEARTELRSISKEMKRIRRSKGSGTDTDTDTDLENEIVG